MKISYEQIKEKKPCKDGLVWWLETFGKRDVESQEFYDKCNIFSYREWFKKQYFCETLDEFDNIKVGQFVYREKYGIGSYEKILISKIEKTTREVVFFWLGSESQHYECHRKDFFVTLEGLKEHWIRKIISISE